MRYQKRLLKYFMKKNVSNSKKKISLIRGKEFISKAFK